MHPVDAPKRAANRLNRLHQDAESGSSQGGGASFALKLTHFPLRAVLKVPVLRHIEHSRAMQSMLRVGEPFGQHIR